MCPWIAAPLARMQALIASAAGERFVNPSITVAAGERSSLRSTHRFDMAPA